MTYIAIYGKGTQANIVIQLMTIDEYLESAGRIELTDTIVTCSLIN